MKVLRTPGQQNVAQSFLANCIWIQLKQFCSLMGFDIFHGTTLGSIKLSVSNCFLIELLKLYFAYQKSENWTWVSYIILFSNWKYYYNKVMPAIDVRFDLT